jgi:hypothetical protein
VVAEMRKKRRRDPLSTQGVDSRFRRPTAGKV